MKTLIATILILAVAACAGCSGLNASPPVEEITNKVIDKAIVPAIKAGIEQGVRQYALQTGMQGINPKYVVDFEGFWVVGVKGKAEIGVEGLSGQLQITSTGDDETENSPANTPSAPPAE